MSTPDPSASWILDALPDGVLLVDGEWRIRFVNAAAERLLHLRREDVVGLRVGVELPEPPAERMAVYREVMELREPRFLRQVALAGPEHEGRYYDAEVHPSPSGGIALVFRDITSFRDAEEAATRLGRILESSWSEVYIFDAESLRFLQVSRGAIENLGYTMEELSELTPLDLKPEFSEEAFARLLAPLRRGEQALLVFETVHRRRDGSLYPVEVRLQLARSEVVPVFIALILDITERKQTEEQLEAQALELELLNQELRQRTEELEDALATRNRFYAAMSHELRTPINAVIGYNDLILAGVYGELSEKQEQGISRSQKAARHLLEIVSDVLDISRLEAGKVELQPEEVETSDLLQDLAISAAPLAERRGSELRLQLDHCPPRIRTDPRRVRQILLNLVSNAAKFGAGQPVDLRCGSGSEGELVLEVADRGPGIAPEDRQRIFEEFVQLRPGDNNEGTGLGLPISRRLAAVLGGTLEVESEVGRGSTFRLVLPAEAPGEASEPGA